MNLLPLHSSKLFCALLLSLIFASLGKAWAAAPQAQRAPSSARRLPSADASFEATFTILESCSARSEPPAAPTVACQLGAAARVEKIEGSRSVSSLSQPTLAGLAPAFVVIF